MTIIIDAVVYLALCALSFGAVATLHRAVLGPVRNHAERILFWSVWIALSILLAGFYHVATGDLLFGRMLEVFALLIALGISVGSTIWAASALSRPKPAASDAPPLAQDTSRRRIEEHRQQYLAENRRQLAANDRRLLR